LGSTDSGAGRCLARQCGAMEILQDGLCVNIFSPGLCPEGERMFFDMFGRERCGCKEGRGRINQTCQILYTRGECGEGKVLVGKSLAKKCGRGSTCVRKTECSAYQEVLENVNGKEEIDVINEYLEQFSCDLGYFSFAWSRENTSPGVCCSDAIQDSFLSPERIIQQLVSETEAACVSSPCADGMKVAKEGSDLVCNDPGFTPLVRYGSVIGGGKDNCGRRRVWNDLVGRCVRVFMG